MGGGFLFSKRPANVREHFFLPSLWAVGRGENHGRKRSAEERAATPQEREGRDGRRVEINDRRIPSEYAVPFQKGKDGGFLPVEERKLLFFHRGDTRFPQKKKQKKKKAEEIGVDLALPKEKREMSLPRIVEREKKVARRKLLPPKGDGEGRKTRGRNPISQTPGQSLHHHKKEMGEGRKGKEVPSILWEKKERAASANSQFSLGRASGRRGETESRERSGRSIARSTKECSTLCSVMGRESAFQLTRKERGTAR